DRLEERVSNRDRLRLREPGARRGIDPRSALLREGAHPRILLGWRDDVAFAKAGVGLLLLVGEHHARDRVARDPRRALEIDGEPNRARDALLGLLPVSSEILLRGDARADEL